MCRGFEWEAFVSSLREVVFSKEIEKMKKFKGIEGNLILMDWKFLKS